MTLTQIIIVLAVGMVASIIKSAMGMGYPLILLPLIALFTDVFTAVAIVAIPNLFLNAVLWVSLRQHRGEARTLNRFLVGGAVGAGVGTMLLPLLSDDLLRVVLIVVIVAFLINRMSPRTFEMSDQQSHGLAPVVGVIAGAFQGGAGISGPIVTPWFLSLSLPRDVYIFATTTVFALTGFVQIVVLALNRSFSSDTLIASVVLIPLGYAFFPVGRALRERVSFETFERIVLVLLACSAISLAVRLL